MRDDPALPRQGAFGRSDLLSVQVLRAVAALSVVIHHAGFDADTIAGAFGQAPLEIDRSFDWTFGINLFFVISGFIMVRTARGFGQPGASLRFLGRRLMRVVPLYWLTTSLVLIGAALAPSLLNVPIDGWGLVLGSYLFVPVTRVNGEIRPVLGQGWTLNYELFFYLVFAATMILPRRPGLCLMAVILIGLVIMGRATHPSQAALLVWSDGLLLEFLLGTFVGLVTETHLRLGAWAAPILAAGGLGATILLAPPGRFALGLDPWIVEGVPAAMILAGCTWGPAWPRHPLIVGMALLGDASYSLYLTHPFVIRLLRVGWTAVLAGTAPPFLFLAAAVPATIVVSLGVFRWVERPMTLALHRRFVSKGEAGSTPAKGRVLPTRCGP